MKERPILFSGPMVRAILEGRKTQTRRVIKPQPTERPLFGTHGNGRHVWYQDDADNLYCPYGQPGDRLWVRETWANHPDNLGPIYRATDPGWDDNDYGIKWRPSIHMPRRYSRLTLEITNVRVERVQEITPRDVVAEGLFHEPGEWGEESEYGYVRLAFGGLWNDINAKRGYSWESNPWVWVVEFRRLT